MKIMQMIFGNELNILMKLLLNSEAGFFFSCLETGLTHCFMPQWLAVDTSLKFSQMAGKLCCWLVVGLLLNKDFYHMILC